MNTARSFRFLHKRMTSGAYIHIGRKRMRQRAIGYIAATHAPPPCVPPNLGGALWHARWYAATWSAHMDL